MPEYYLENVLPLGVLTGSRAFNCATDKSDWDIVIIESAVPEYQKAWDYQVTDFAELEENPNGGLPGIDVSEHADLLGEEFIEYDRSTIWGPIIKIIKYWYLADPEDESTEVCINLFVYQDKYKYLYDNFKQLNTLMNLWYGTTLQDKDIRIEAFTKVIKKVGITDA